MGLVLPGVPSAVADYVPALAHDGLVHVSGQLPMCEGVLMLEGTMPGAGSLEEARASARQCVLNGLAAVGGVIDGDWSRFRRVVSLTVFVASEPGFTEQHLVANGASEFLGELFGEAGRHVRAAVGASALPLGATVEVAMVVSVA